MKQGVHPDNYRPVVFQDLNNDATFLTRSTATSDETIKWEDGNEYPLIKVHISSASHPFYTGQEKLVDVEGRVDRFKARQKAAADKREALANKAKKAKSKEKTEAGGQKIGGGSHQNKKSKNTQGTKKVLKQDDQTVDVKSQAKQTQDTDQKSDKEK